MDLGDLSGGELLDFVDGLARTQRETEVAILLAARQHAVLNDAESIPGWQLKAQGGERPRRFGGVGTPLVAEFSPASFAARLGISTYAGRELMADALDLDHRLPRLWERVQAFEVKVSYARLVARKTRDLTKEQADYVDERVAESADGRISWSRFETLVEAAIKAADPRGRRAAGGGRAAPTVRQPHRLHRGRDARVLHPRPVRGDRQARRGRRLLRHQCCSTSATRHRGRAPGQGDPDPGQPCPCRRAC